jgi:hypothetical protein
MLAAFEDRRGVQRGGVLAPSLARRAFPRSRDVRPPRPIASSHVVCRARHGGPSKMMVLRVRAALTILGLSAVLVGCNDGHGASSSSKDAPPTPSVSESVAPPASPSPSPPAALFAGTGQWTTPDGYRMQLHFSLDSLGPAQESTQNAPPGQVQLQLPISGSMILTNETTGHDLPAGAIAPGKFVAEIHLLFKAPRPACHLYQNVSLVEEDTIRLAAPSRGTFCDVRIFGGEGSEDALPSGQQLLLRMTAIGGGEPAANENLAASDVVTFDNVREGAYSSLASDFARGADAIVVTVPNDGDQSPTTPVHCDYASNPGATINIIASQPAVRC